MLAWDARSVIKTRKSGAMCLILVAWHGHAEYPCVIAANRDEFHARPSARAHWWHTQPAILAGQDLSAGGTWLGMTQRGRFAALTNYRDPEERRRDAPSRGHLVTSILQSTDSIEEILNWLLQTSDQYNGFNLLFSDSERLAVYESKQRAGRVLGPGIYGLSNHLLDTPWPKVVRAKSLLSEALLELPATDAALALLRDTKPAADEDLPRTGLDLPWERLLSSAFIKDADYGTRCSTIIRIDQAHRACFDEWSWGASGELQGTQSFQFAVG